MKGLMFILILFPLSLYAQNKQFDRLEMLYDQGHYKKVLRSANKLIKKPEYQQSALPIYYKSLAQLQLYRNEKWRNKNSGALEEAAKGFAEFRKLDKDGKIFMSHLYEIQSLKRDYASFLEELEQSKKSNTKLIESVNKAIASIFENIEDIKDSNDKISIPPLVGNVSDLRKDLVKFAYKYSGTKYRSGGDDPNGFDCSGFVSFVYKEFKIDLPRISRDQQKSAKPLKAIDTQPGDLVFFSNGTNVNHVGIVVENKNGFITMIHSSTSLGIVVTDIETSNYWKTRVHSFGSYIKD